MVRKFICRHPTCGRHIFTERLSDLVALDARKPYRLGMALRAIGVAGDGVAGPRLAACLRLPTSAPPAGVSLISHPVGRTSVEETHT
jgi:hypothetical protein